MAKLNDQTMLKFRALGKYSLILMKIYENNFKRRKKSRKERK